jgi:hypothetical protein
MWPLYLFRTAIASYLIYNRYFHPLAKVPGPFLASISPVWIVWQSYKQRRPRLDVALHKRHGSVVRIAPGEVLFANPKYFNTVYGAGVSQMGKKGRWYESTGDMNKRGVS